MEHLYSKMIAKKYNHHMASGFMPVLPLTALWDGAPFSDGPAGINHTIYTDPASPQTSMSLDVWASLEGHLAHLNSHDISVQFFQGLNAQGAMTSTLTSNPPHPFGRSLPQAPSSQCHAARSQRAACNDFF